MLDFMIAPIGDAPGNFLDQNKEPAYRQSGLGEDGLIFRFTDESVFVWWDEGSGNDISHGTVYDS